MLTTTVDGLWVLQVLSGIEVLAPELGLRPHLPRSETAATALCHPAAAELREAGVITVDGEVDNAVLEWLTVLSRRDIALLLCVQNPVGRERIVLARFAKWWVALERHGMRVRLSGAGAATTEMDAAQVIATQIDRLCGRLQPAEIRPLSFEVDRMVTAAREGRGVGAWLDGRLDPAQAQALTAAADTRQCAQTSLVAIQAGEQPHLAGGVVTIIDTPHGRLLSEHVALNGRAWMIVAPGSSSAIARAVGGLLRRTPAQADWYCHRKAV